jgi:hypothetical protein
MVVKADPDSMVKVLAVDKSVKLLREGNDITPNRVKLFHKYCFYLLLCSYHILCNYRAYSRIMIIILFVNMLSAHFVFECIANIKTDIHLLL